MPTLKRVAITGSSGYLGGKLVEHCQAGGATVLGLDVKPPTAVQPDEFEQADMCDTGLADRLLAFQPDTVIHSAFVFQPMRDENRMREINIGGATNVFNAVALVKPERFLLVSSATAFGAWPDNPVPIPEDWPLRARTEYQYAADKTEIEALVAKFAEQHQEISTSWVRPAIIGGPRMDNYLYRFIFGMPFLARLDGFDVPLQFVHEDDVVDAIGAVLAANGRGAYNVGPPDWTPITVVASETRRRAIRLPFWLARFFAGLAWKSRFWPHETPAGFLYFARYPWVVEPSRLINEIGYEFRFSSTDTVREIFHHQQSTNT